MNIIVVGCGRVGAEIAYGLYRRGHKVAVIDQDAGAFRNLPPDFRGLTMQGDVLTQDVLQRAGIEQAQALAAVTPSDSVNIVLGHIARVVYHVPNIVVRNYDPRKRPLHQEFGLQTISPSLWGAERIAEMLSGTQLQAVHASEGGEVEIRQFVVPAAWHGRLLKELLAEGEGAVVAVTRAKRSFLPKAADAMEAGDILLVSATHETAELLRAQLERTQGA